MENSKAETRLSPLGYSKKDAVKQLGKYVVEQARGAFRDHDGDIGQVIGIKKQNNGFERTHEYALVVSWQDRDGKSYESTLTKDEKEIWTRSLRPHEHVTVRIGMKRR